MPASVSKSRRHYALRFEREMLKILFPWQVSVMFVAAHPLLMLLRSGWGCGPNSAWVETLGLPWLPRG